MYLVSLTVYAVFFYYTSFHNHIIQCDHIPIVPANFWKVKGVGVGFGCGGLLLSRLTGHETVKTYYTIQQ